MKNKAIVSCFLVVIMGFVPASLQAGKNSKQASIDIKNQRIASYRVMKKKYEKVPEVIKPAELIDVIEDIIALKPQAGGYVQVSKRHDYEIICTSQTQIQNAKFVNITVGKGLFIIPAIGTIIGVIDGTSYRLESVKKAKATLKNPEQLALVLSVKR